jgi:hypothetical protein
MSKIHKDRLLKSYGELKKKRGKLMNDILAKHTEDIHKRVITTQYTMLTDRLQKIINQIQNIPDMSDTKKRIRVQEHAFNIPKVFDTVKPHIVWADNAEARGHVITDNLRERISGNLKKIITKPEYSRTRGKLTGTLKDQAILDMRKELRLTFYNYTKVDPTIGIPKNIKAIATTETRRVVNQTKQDYVSAFVSANPDIIMIKRWIHGGNVWGARNYHPRRNHRKLHGKEITFDQDFMIKDETTGAVYLVPCPHDESLPPEQVIGCQCSIQYIARKGRIREYSPRGKKE